MIKKQMYESPEVELLEVRLNSNLMGASGFNDDGNQTPVDGGDEDF